MYAPNWSVKTKADIIFLKILFKKNVFNKKQTAELGFN